MKILVLGSFSGSNFGDTLVLCSLAQQLRTSVDGGVTLVVPTARPEQIIGIEGVEPVDISMRRVRTYRFLGPAVVRALKDCQAVLTTAGILFDRHLLDPRKNFIGSAAPLLGWARRSGRIVYGLNVGVTPSTNRMGRFVLRTMLLAHDIVAVRDSDSAQVAKELASEATVVERADMAHSLLDLQPAAEAPGGGGAIGVSLAAYLSSFDPTTGGQATLSDADGVVRQAAALVDVIRHRTGQDLRLIATSDMDHAMHMRIAGHCRGEVETVSLAGLTMDEALGELRSLSLLVGSRLHACICGTSLGVPTLALAYERKVSSYMSEVGAGDWVLPFAAIKEPGLADKVVGLLEEGRHVAPVIRKATQQRATLARESVKDLVTRVRERYAQNNPV